MPKVACGCVGVRLALDVRRQALAERVLAQPLLEHAQHRAALLVGDRVEDLEDPVLADVTLYISLTDNSLFSRFSFINAGAASR